MQGFCAQNETDIQRAAPRPKGNQRVRREGPATRPTPAWPLCTTTGDNREHPMRWAVDFADWSLNQERLPKYCPAPAIRMFRVPSPTVHREWPSAARARATQDSTSKAACKKLECFPAPSTSICRPSRQRHRKHPKGQTSSNTDQEKTYSIPAPTAAHFMGAQRAL